MTNLDELEALSMAADGDWFAAGEYLSTRSETAISFIAAASPDTVLSLIAEVRGLENAIADMRKRYEDWHPIDVVPNDPDRYRTLYEFYTDGDGDDATWRTATWADRPTDATHWCLIRTPLGPYFGGDTDV